MIRIASISLTKVLLNLYLPVAVFILLWAVFSKVPLEELTINRALIPGKYSPFPIIGLIAVAIFAIYTVVMSYKALFDPKFIWIKGECLYILGKRPIRLSNIGKNSLSFENNFFSKLIQIHLRSGRLVKIRTALARESAEQICAALINHSGGRSE